MTNLTATYSPEDDKLRLSAPFRLPQETYNTVKAVGFSWAPRQKVFYAVWTPEREDVLLQLCGDIEDEDTTVIDRAEERAERFEGYSSKRSAEGDAASGAVDKLQEHWPLGQPILVGHHSEGRARRHMERMHNLTRKACKLWEQADYWKERAAAAVHHAEYRLKPAVRARRIKKLEAELRRLKRIGNPSEDIARWIAHLENRAVYEKDMLKADGGIATDRVPLEIGGAIQAFPSTGGKHEWAVIEGVNRQSVKIDVGWSKKNIPFDKITSVMTAREVAEASAGGRLESWSWRGMGFLLVPRPNDEVQVNEPKVAVGL